MPEADVRVCIDLQGLGGFPAVGDLDGDGRCEYVVTQGTRSLAAFDNEGNLLWKKIRRVYGQMRVHVECEMPTLVYDIDGDGKAEVICRWYLEDTRDAIPFLMILDGLTGEIKRHVALPIGFWPESNLSLAHSGKIVVGRIEHDRPPHLVLGGMCWGLAITDHELRLRFCDPQFGRVRNRMTGFGLTHTPRLFDVDDDGTNELFLGRVTCRADGEVLWMIDPEKFSPRQIDHVDSLAVADINGDGRYEVAVSNAGSVFDARTGELIWQHQDRVLHGQQLRLARVREDAPGLQILIADAKSKALRIFSADGRELLSLPRPGQLVPLVWQGNGYKQIQHGPSIVDGQGQEICRLPISEALSASGYPWPNEQPGTTGHWTGCDVDGDGLEEAIWINRDRLIVFGNPSPEDPKHQVVHDETYWQAVANTGRY